MNDLPYVDHEYDFQQSSIASLQEKAGLDLVWYERQGGLYGSDPYFNPEAQKLTFLEFSNVFADGILYLTKKYDLRDLRQITVLNVTKFFETIHERGLPQTTQNPDQPPHQGIPLQNFTAPFDWITFDDLGAQLNTDSQRFNSLYPFILSSVKDSLLKTDSGLLFIPEFLKDTSPWVKKFPQMAQELGIKAIVFMREEHGGDFSLVDIKSKTRDIK